MRGRDLDPVEAARGSAAAERVAGDQLLDLADAAPAARRGSAGSDRGGCQRRRARGARPGYLLATAVQELHEEARAVRLNRFCDTTVGVDDLRQITGELVGGEDPGRIEGGRLHHDQARAAAARAWW